MHLTTKRKKKHKSKSFQNDICIVDERVYARVSFLNNTSLFRKDTRTQGR